MDQGWQEPESVPHLGQDELQVWRVGLAGSLQELNGLLSQSYAVLTGEERERAARMRTGAPRNEFVVGRGCLRRLLGAVMEIDPRMIVLEVGEHGKPRLRSEPLAFNVSHSRGVLLIAIALGGDLGGDVGVDVEYMDARVELLDVARSAFHPADMERIGLEVTEEARLREFYRCWTRREAVVKADGRGLLVGPEQFCVGEDVGEAAVTLVGDSTRTYFVRGIEVGVTHLAAVASSFRPILVNRFDLLMRSPLLYAE